MEHEQLERFLKGERSVVETIDTSENVEGEEAVNGGMDINCFFNYLSFLKS